MASGTGDESGRLDYETCRETTPTQIKQPYLKHSHSKPGIQVNQKHMKKCQDLLKNIRASIQWNIVATASAVSETRDVLQKQLEFIDTIEKNLLDLKYVKCSDFQGEIQSFLMTLHQLTQGQNELREKVSQLLDFST